MTIDKVSKSGITKEQAMQAYGLLCVYALELEGLTHDEKGDITDRLMDVGDMLRFDDRIEVKDADA